MVRVRPVSSPPPRPQAACPPYACLYSRHDRGFSQEGLGSGIVLDALNCNSVAPVITQHHIWGRREGCCFLDS